MEKTLVFKKARIAPTPSGYLHLGNVLSFAITAALAEKAGAKLLLRIDDPDRERTNKIYVQDIFDTLNFLEIPWHEGPRSVEEYEREYSQVHRMDLYHAALQQLRETGALFACTCTRTDVFRLSAESIYSGTCRSKNIPLDAGNVNWRIKTNDARNLQIKTLQGPVTQNELPKIMQDFAVRKRDGFPGYQVTSLVDDVHFGVDLVVRGEDLWPSTLAQTYLAQQLRYKSFLDTTFYHHPLLLDDAGHKLSKSLGATSVQYFRKQHKKPADIYDLISHILGINAHTNSWRELVQMMKLVPDSLV